MLRALTRERTSARRSNWAVVLRIRCSASASMLAVASGDSAAARKAAVTWSVLALVARNFCVAAAESPASMPTAAARSACTACIAYLDGSPTRS